MNDLENAARKARMRTRYEYTVRSHTFYSVSRFQVDYDPLTGVEYGHGSEGVADGMDVRHANELARILGRSDRCKVSLLDAGKSKWRWDECRRDALRGEVLKKLEAFPAGARVTFTSFLDETNGAGALGLEEVWLVPVTVEPQAGERVEPDPTSLNWQNGGLLWREVEEIKAKLVELPYPLAAAIRRNAHAQNDTTMLKLLDAAGAAVDALGVSPVVQSTEAWKEKHRSEIAVIMAFLAPHDRFDSRRLARLLTWTENTDKAWTTAEHLATSNCAADVQEFLEQDPVCVQALHASLMAMLVQERVVSTA